MRLNSLGNVCAGVGAGTVSIDHVAIGTGGSPGWFNDHTVVYSKTVGPDSVATVSYDTITKKTTEVSNTSNDVKAGGNIWAKWAPGPKGLVTSSGREIPKAGLFEVGPDGIIYYMPDRQSDHGLVALYPDRHEVLISANAFTPLSLRGTNGKGCIWVGPLLKPFVWQLPSPVVATKVHSPRPAFINNEWWLVYGDGTRILAQPFHEPKGYVIANLGNTFDLDCVALNGKLRVAYALTAGEGPNQYQITDVDLSKPRVPLGTTPIPPEPEPEPPVSIPNHLDVVKAARLKYNDLSGAERAGKIVNQVAWDLKGEGAGTFFKNSGDNYNERSIDIIIYKPAGETFDILGDAEGSANPQWARTQPTGFGDVAKWRAATDPGGSNPIPPTPTDPARNLLKSIRSQIDEFFGDNVS